MKERKDQAKAEARSAATPLEFMSLRTDGARVALLAFERDKQSGEVIPASVRAFVHQHYLGVSQLPSYVQSHPSVSSRDADPLARGVTNPRVVFENHYRGPGGPVALIENRDYRSRDS